MPLLLPTDLIAPAGYVERSLFPGESLEARMQAYIAEAEERGIEDRDTIAAWAYHRAFRAAFLLMTSQPATRSFDDQGSSNYLITQIQNLRDESDRWLEIFNTLSEPSPSVTEAQSRTTSMRHDSTW
jgi:hypothetical protein